MLIYDLAKTSGDVILTPIKILTGWGTDKMRKLELQLKKQVLEINLHRGGKTSRWILPHIPTIYGRNGNMGHTKNKDKRQ